MENNRFFPEIHGKFGFGCMRLPLIGEEVDLPQFTRMVDRFLEQAAAARSPCGRGSPAAIPGIVTS